MYSHKYNLVLGFHGCDKKLRDEVVSGSQTLKASSNDYDWLGHGYYFWENNSGRAQEWAKSVKKYQKSKTMNEPSVLGAVLDLGFCLDLLNSKYINFIKEAYITLAELHSKQGKVIPENKKINEDDNDKILRKLDCAVIEYLHYIREKNNNQSFDSVRGLFEEGTRLYPTAGFREKSHIQICIRNPNCIKGFFIPRKENAKYNNP